MAIKVSKYWARASGKAQSVDGQDFWLTKLAGSDLSPQHAKKRAEEALSALKSRIQEGHTPPEEGYAYCGHGEIREQVIETVTDDDGEVSLAITRNRYGALILNTDNVLFADIDFPEPPSKGFFATLFGRGPSLAERKETVKQDTLARVAAYAAANPKTGLRVYATHSGLRVVVTHDVYSPDSATSKKVLTDLQSDPLFQALCERQSCYRARLTPKPWRCGAGKPSRVFPMTEPEDISAFDAWLSKYDAKRTAYGVCHLVAEHGPAHRHPAVNKVLDIHDTYTLVDQTVALA